MDGRFQAEKTVLNAQRQERAGSLPGMGQCFSHLPSFAVLPQAWSQHLPHFDFLLIVTRLISGKCSFDGDTHLFGRS